MKRSHRKKHKRKQLARRAPPIAWRPYSHHRISLQRQLRENRRATFIYWTKFGTGGGRNWKWRFFREIARGFGVASTHNWQELKIQTDAKWNERWRLDSSYLAELETQASWLWRVPRSLVQWCMRLGVEGERTLHKGDGGGELIVAVVKGPGARRDHWTDAFGAKYSLAIWIFPAAH